MTETSARDEVVRLHRFFDAWYAGVDGLTIEEFSDAMDPTFVIVGPDGDIIGRDTVVSAVDAAFGKGGVSISVDHLEVIERTGYVVCRYEETHTSAEATTVRISTAVMEPNGGTPGGYRWITVHETWASP